jgi:hypothetical protein
MPVGPVASPHGTKALYTDILKSVQKKDIPVNRKPSRVKNQLMLGEKEYDMLPEHRKDLIIHQLSDKRDDTWRPLKNSSSLICMNFLTHLRTCSLNHENSA